MGIVLYIITLFKYSFSAPMLIMSNSYNTYASMHKYNLLVYYLTHLLSEL